MVVVVVVAVDIIFEDGDYTLPFAVSLDRRKGWGGGGGSTEAAADIGMCDTKTRELCESRGGCPFNFVCAWILLTQLNTQSACQHSSVQDGVYAFEKSRMRS